MKEGGKNGKEGAINQTDVHPYYKQYKPNGFRKHG